MQILITLLFAVMMMAGLFLLLLGGIVLELLLLFEKFLLLYLGHAAGDEALVDFLLEVIRIFLEPVAPAGHLLLYALDLGLDRGTEVVGHVVLVKHPVEAEIYDCTGVCGGFGLLAFCYGSGLAFIANKLADTKGYNAKEGDDTENKGCVFHFIVVYLLSFQCT